VTTIEWDQFIESLESPSREWCNSVDRSALSRLTGDERERAIQLLLSKLDVGWAKVSRAFGVLPDPRVQAAVEKHLTTAAGHDKLATACALLELIPGHAKAIEAVKEGLASPDPLTSDEALRAAELIGKPILEDLVAAAVTHPDRSLRIGAIKLALFHTGVNKSRMSWEHRDLIVALATGGTDERRYAFAQLCGLMGVDLNAYRGPRP
jgi:hypothetical protein